MPLQKQAGLEVAPGPVRMAIEALHHTKPMQCVGHPPLRGPRELGAHLCVVLK